MNKILIILLLISVSGYSQNYDYLQAYRRFTLGSKSVVGISSDTSMLIASADSLVTKYAVKGYINAIIGRDTAPSNPFKYLNGYKKYVPLNTDSIAEGNTNKYYTDIRARSALSVTGNGSYNSTTGAITINGQVKSRDFFYSSAFNAYRLADVLYGLVDDYTGENLVFRKVTDTAGIQIDSVLYNIKDGEVFRRVLTKNTLNPEWYGLKGDGITENGAITNQMMLKIKTYGPGYHLLFPANKTFICSSTWGNPGDNFTLEGADKWTSIIKSNAPTPQSNGVYGYVVMFGLDYGISNGCTIRNIRFETFDCGRIVTAGGQVKDFVIDNCTSNASLIDFQSGSYAKNLPINQYGNRDPYDSTTELNINRNVRITNNILESNRDIARGKGAIGVGYTDGAIISGNFITGYNQGIIYWGGDAASYQGLYPSKKWARHITITGNKVNNIYGGGIWGSNGEYISIGNNVVYDCYDVCIDVEGSSRAEITGNVVTNGKNGGITTFFDCSVINVTGNTVTSDVNNSYLFQIYQAFQTIDNQDISVHDNTFNNTGTGLSFVGGDNARDFIFSNNSLINTKIRATGNNYKTVEISDNKIRLYNASDDNTAIINVRGYHTNAKAFISDNTVTSLVTQPPGVMGIYIIDDDYNTSNKAYIERNNLSGFARAIVVDVKTTNTDIEPEFYINNNSLGQGIFERYESLSRSRVMLSGNKTGYGQPYPSAIPLTGKWDAGQRVEFLVPDSGYTGAICITKGTPGVWKKTGITAGVSAFYEPPIVAGTAAQYWRGDKTWQTLTKATVGLPLVDNTSDLNKPISTSVQNALNQKPGTGILNGNTIDLNTWLNGSQWGAMYRMDPAPANNPVGTIQGSPASFFVFQQGDSQRGFQMTMAESDVNNDLYFRTGYYGWSVPKKIWTNYNLRSDVQNDARYALKNQSIDSAIVNQDGMLKGQNGHIVTATSPDDFADAAYVNNAIDGLPPLNVSTSSAGYRVLDVTNATTIKQRPFIPGSGVVMSYMADSSMFIDTKLPDYIEITANYSITAANSIINCISGTFNVSLPVAAAANKGKIFYIANKGTGTISIITNAGQLIDGAEVATIAAGKTTRIASTGLKWITLN